MLTVINFIPASGSLRIVFANENRHHSLGVAQVHPLEVL